MSLTVLCPSRERVDACWAVWKSFQATRTDRATRLIFVIDEDDPQFEAYHGGRESEHGKFWLETIHPQHGGGMVAALNAAAREALERWDDTIGLGFIGDDHRFRSQGWDEKIEVALEQPGIGFVYGNDLAQGAGLPTQVFIRSEIVRALGWMGLPPCHHLYIDNAWKELGAATSSLHYFKDVVIEHLHPAFGKAEWDEGHLRVNTPAMYGHDGAAFETWRQSPAFLEDVERVRLALGPAVPR